MSRKRYLAVGQLTHGPRETSLADNRHWTLRKKIVVKPRLYRIPEEVERAFWIGRRLHQDLQGLGPVACRPRRRHPSVGVLQPDQTATHQLCLRALPVKPRHSVVGQRLCSEKRRPSALMVMTTRKRRMMMTGERRPRLRVGRQHAEGVRCRKDSVSGAAWLIK